MDDFDDGAPPDQVDHDLDQIARLSELGEQGAITEKSSGP